MKKTPSQHRQFKLLVVEDDAQLLDIIRLCLEDEGYEVTTADCGVHALDRLSEGRIDLVLSDIRMPRGNGTTLLRTVRQRDTALPFIVMTGYSDLLPDQAREIGASAYFQKPLDLEALLQTIEVELQGAHLH